MGNHTVRIITMSASRGAASWLKRQEPEADSDSRGILPPLISEFYPISEFHTQHWEISKVGV